MKKRNYFLHILIFTIYVILTHTVFAVNEDQIDRSSYGIKISIASKATPVYLYFYNVGGSYTNNVPVTPDSPYEGDFEPGGDPQDIGIQFKKVGIWPLKEVDRQNFTTRAPINRCFPVENLVTEGDLITYKLKMCINTEDSLIPGSNKYKRTFIIKISDLHQIQHTVSGAKDTPL